MYTPASFLQENADDILSLIHEHPLAALLTCTSHGPEANHIPLLYEPGTNSQGKLIGHVAKANSLWQSYSAGTEAVAMFQGPGHYISPNWYPSKHEHGRAVPTWNYTAVHIRGTLTIHHDPAWLLDAVTRLTNHAEASQPNPWKVSDAPPEFIDGMLNAIVGIEMRVTSIEAKWKVSQNRSAEDRAGVASALREIDTSDAQQMAKLVRP